MLTTINKTLVRLIRRGIVDPLAGLAGRSNLLANLFYVFSQRFAREHRAVLYGRSIHRRQLREHADADASRHTLRRNIHRLEKGLIMRPRRSVFAKDYIVESINGFEWLVNNSGGETEDSVLLRNWANDVLHHYFAVVGEDSLIDGQRERFNRIVRSECLTPGTCRPYARDPTPLRITYDDLLELAHRRRSCRWYLPKPVPREIIDRAIAVASQSPSACNRQPFQFRIFDNPKDASRIGSIPLGTKGFFANFPCVAVLVGNLRAFPMDRDRHVPYIDGALAAMAFQFALEVQGVGSCCINFPDVSAPERAMADALQLRPDERPIMLISFGYPDPEGEVPYSQKKSLDELRRYG